MNNDDDVFDAEAFRQFNPDLFTPPMAPIPQDEEEADENFQIIIQPKERQEKYKARTLEEKIGIVKECIQAGNRSKIARKHNVQTKLFAIGRRK